MSDRHPSSQAFHDLLKLAGEMHDRKQADYGSETDPFANVRSAADWGLPGSLGACIRMGDKLRRLQSFYRRGSLANESVEDAYMDLLVYAGIGLLLYREESEASAADAAAVLRAASAVGVKPARCGSWAVYGGAPYHCELMAAHSGVHRSGLIQWTNEWADAHPVNSSFRDLDAIGPRCPQHGLLAGVEYVDGRRVCPVVMNAQGDCCSEPVI